MNLPNKLTVTRLVLVLVFAVFAFPYPESLGFMNEGNFFADTREYFALAVYVIASLTDAADGHIARKYHLITDFGKFLDPIASCDGGASFSYEREPDVFMGDAHYTGAGVYGVRHSDAGGKQGRRDCGGYAWQGENAFSDDCDRRASDRGRDPGDSCAGEKIYIFVR